MVDSECYLFPTLYLQCTKVRRAGVDDGCREEFSLPQMIFFFVGVLGFVKYLESSWFRNMSCVLLFKFFTKV